MQIITKSIDDLKTDRKGISPPLPAYLRIVPLLFYLGIIATIVFNGTFFLQLTQANRDMAESKARTQELQGKIAGVQKQRKDLEAEARKASDLLAWIDSTRAMQPLIVDVARSIGTDSALLDLRLNRDAQNPSQVLLSMRLQSDGTRQLDTTLARIASQRFRTFSPQQTLAKGEIDYKVTLLWQDSERQAGEEGATQ